jgi:uncharacterized protein YgbK (DUF1537 family)
MALAAHWTASGALKPRADWPEVVAGGPLLVVSGSCPPVTAAQIDWALAHGFAGVPLDRAHERAAETALQTALQAGRDVVVYSSRGEASAAAWPASLLGAVLGQLARIAVEQTRVRRVVVAGGDTSGHVARALNIVALEMLAPLAPGAPWCRAHAPGTAVDGLALNFKGGQVGAPGYFGVARGDRSPSATATPAAASSPS